MSILVIVESPAKSKTIAKYLGPSYRVQATVGHIVDLAKGPGNLGIDFDNNLEPIYRDIDGKADVIKTIITAARQSDKIYIASDPDREGEAIAFHVLEKVKSLGKEIKRVEFHEITKAGIEKGIANSRNLDYNLYNAQKARRVLDRIVGFMVSPYLSNRFGGVPLSAGRVQSVALRLIVDREREIESFIPEDYWTIDVNLSNGEKFVAIYADKIKSQTVADSVKSDLEKASYKVISVEAKSQKKVPPPPVNTADLQKLAANRFRYSADQTIKAAQVLYEQGFVTYIRTDSYRSSPESIDNVREFIKKSGFNTPNSPNVYKNKDASQDAHEAIRPTNLDLHPDDFMANPDQKNVYRIIWERFVASQMTAAIYDTVQVIIEAKADGRTHKLKANGRALKEKGWLNIFADDEKSTDTILPIIKTSDKLALTAPNVVVEKKATKPPSRYNDGSIIDELKKKGIGRPSTYAAILNKIAARDYTEKVKGFFKPTDLGKKIIDELTEKFSFMSYDYTARMEETLDEMSQGNSNYADVMNKFYVGFREEVVKAKNGTGEQTPFPCPICNGPTFVRHSKYGFFAGCSKYPDCRGVIGVKFENGVLVKNERHQEVDGTSCPKCKKPMVLRDGKFGPFYSCANYPRCNGSKPLPTGYSCVKCNSDMRLVQIEGEQKLGCSGFPDCKNIMDLPKDFVLNWKKPEDVAAKDLSKPVEKIIKKTRNVKLEID